MLTVSIRSLYESTKSCTAFVPVAVSAATFRVTVLPLSAPRRSRVTPPNTPSIWLVALRIVNAPAPDPSRIEASPAAWITVPKSAWVAPPLSAARPFVIVMALLAPLFFDVRRMW